MYSEYAGNTENGWHVIIAHGSTQNKFDMEKPLVEFVRKYVQAVYLIDLPGHGALQLQKPMKLTVDVALHQIKKKLQPLVHNKKIVYIGYSLGGLFGVKLSSFFIEESTKFVGCFIGTGLRITKENENRIHQFFSKKYFETAGWIPLIEQNHGRYWPYLLESLKEWLATNSQLLLTKTELQNIAIQHIFFFLAERDQSFNFEDITFANVPTEHIIRIPGHHFSYFHQRIGWPVLHESLQHILETLV